MTVTNLRTERDKRNRQRIVIEAQRRRHAQVDVAAIAAGVVWLLWVCRDVRARWWPT